MASTWPVKLLARCLTGEDEIETSEHPKTCSTVPPFPPALRVAVSGSCGAGLGTMDTEKRGDTPCLQAGTRLYWLLSPVKSICSCVGLEVLIHLLYDHRVLPGVCVLWH